MKTFLKNQKGFSSIEMIVYIAVFAVFVGTLMSFLLNINNTRMHAQIMLEVNDQGASLMRTLTTTIKGTTAINYPGTGASSGTISVNTTSPGTTPTIFSANGEALFITEGANAAVALTNNKVKITNLTFNNVSRVGTPGTIQIRFTISNTADKLSAYEQYSADFYGSASLR
jgi:hypothetical protein